MSHDKFEFVPIGKLVPSPTNPRKRFDQAQLSELAESIKAHGIIQPLVVRWTVNGLEIVAGERRFRAAQMAGVKEVPVINRVLTGNQVIEIQVIENAQRADVHPLEESEAFGRMIQIGYDAEGIAAKIGKPRPYVLQRLSLSKLSPTAREWFEEGYLLIGHALILSKFDKEEQEALLQDECFKPWEQGRLATPPISHFLQASQRREVALDAAPWDLADTTLHSRGACSTCTFNTGYALLPGMEDSKPRCVKRSCFNEKKTAYADRAIAKTQAQEPKAKQVVGRDIDPWHVSIELEPKQHYTPAVWGLDGYYTGHKPEIQLGQLVYIRKSQASQSTYAEEQAKKQAVAAVKTTENKAILAAALEELPRIQPGSSEFRSIFARLILNTAVGFQSLTVVKKLGENQAERDAVILAMEVPQLVELWVLMTMSTKCKVESWCDYSDTIRDFATTVGIDIEHVVRELDEAKPATKPKAKKKVAAA